MSMFVCVCLCVCEKHNECQSVHTPFQDLKDDRFSLNNSLLRITQQENCKTGFKLKQTSTMQRITYIVYKNPVDICVIGRSMHICVH